MCNQRNKKRVKIPGKKKKVYIDACLVDTVNKINKTPGLKTLACCCGHGKFRETIVVSYPPILVKSKKRSIREYFSQVNVPYTKTRCKNYYVMDKNSGIYYIPVVEEVFSDD